MTIEFPEFTIRQSTYAPGLRQNRHSHDHSNVTVVTGGHIEEVANAGQHCARASSVVLKAAGCEHENRVSGVGAATLTIQFRPSSSLNHEVRSGAWIWFERLDVVRIAVALQQALAAGDASLLERRARRLASLVLGLQAHPAEPPAWIHGIKSVLDTNFDQTVRFDQLARDFGLHPVYASRAFVKHEGVSMTGYVLALRIRCARHLLAATTRSIAAIAGEAGFSDASHLSRTFLNTLDVSPRAYRRMTSIG